LADEKPREAHIATQILKTHLSDEWVNQPWVNCCKFSGSPEKKDRVISFSEITQVVLFSNGDMTIYVRAGAGITFGTDEGYSIKGRGYSEKSAGEIATALVSLGAKLNSVKVYRRG
jgi:hypothetical protein